MKPPEGLPHWPDYQYLNAWLQVATKDLSVESRARIRQEITDHFHEAVAEGLRAGLTEDAAAEQAVEGLGNPKAARRSFRRTHLTPWQANLVRGFVDAPEPATTSTALGAVLAAQRSRDLEESRKRRLFASTMIVLLTAAMIALDLRHDTRLWQLRVGIVVLMMVATIVLVSTVPRLFRRGRERAAIALGASAELSLMGGYIIAVMDGDSPGVWLSLLVVYVVVMAALYLPLLRKLSTRREST